MLSFKVPEISRAAMFPTYHALVRVPERGAVYSTNKYMFFPLPIILCSALDEETHEKSSRARLANGRTTRAESKLDRNACITTAARVR